jgi:hypothetical protein
VAVGTDQDGNKPRHVTDLVFLDLARRKSTAELFR